MSFVFYWSLFKLSAVAVQAGLTAMDYAEMNNRPDVLLILRLTIKARLLASKVSSVSEWRPHASTHN